MMKIDKLKERKKTLELQNEFALAETKRLFKDITKTSSINSIGRRIFEDEKARQVRTNSSFSILDVSSNLFKILKERNSL